MAAWPWEGAGGLLVHPGLFARLILATCSRGHKTPSVAVGHRIFPQMQLLLQQPRRAPQEFVSVGFSLGSRVMEL